MLPSLQAPTKRLSINAHRKKKSKRRHNFSSPKSDSLVKEKERSRGKPSFLPFITQGSLTASQWEERIIESRSMRPSKTRVKQRGGGFREYVNPNLSETSYDHRSIQTTDVPFKYNSIDYQSKGWSLQNPNPRLLQLQSVTGRFQKDMPFAYGHVSEYAATKTVANPHIEFLYHRRTSYSRGLTSIVTNGAVATLYDRFQCPPISVQQSYQDNAQSTQDTPRSLPSSLPISDEGCCVHRKACSYDKIPEEKNVSSRDLFKRWERSSRTLISETSRHSSSGSSICDQNGGWDTNRSTPIHPRIPKGPTPSPPKIQKRRPKGTSLESLRKTVKKVSYPHTDSHEKLYDKRRRSTHTISNNSPNKKSKNKLNLKPEESSDKVPQEDTNTAIDEVNKNGNYDKLETVCDKPVTIDMEVDLLSVDDSDKNDVISDVKSVSIVTTPPGARRVVTPKILKIHADELKDENAISNLRQMFTKLDNDGDGHLSFNELKRSLASDLTKRQLDYLKKIYTMACESTFFGFEEFVAVHQICDVIAHVSHSVFKAFESLDIHDVEESLSTYLDLFNILDEKQTGSIDAAVFKELLSSAMNVQKGNDLLETILMSMGKTNNDTISRVEILAFLPFFISISPSKT